MGGRPECLSLLLQGKGCTRDQNRKVSGLWEGGMWGQVGNGTGKCQPHVPKETECSCVSGTWEVGLRLTRI